MVIGMEVKNKVQEMRNFANAAKKKYYRKEWRKSSSNWNGSESVGDERFGECSEEEKRRGREQRKSNWNEKKKKKAEKEDKMKVKNKVQEIR